MRSLPSRSDGLDVAGPRAPGPRIGQVYLDVGLRQLFCLNDRAREMQREGIPFTPADLSKQPLRTLEGEPVDPEDLPLIRAWSEGQPQEAIFVWTRPGGAVENVSWSAAPLRDSHGNIVAVAGSVILGPLEPDWQALAGLAHDFRSPLQALRMLVTVLETTPILDVAQQRTILDRIRASAERAQSIGLDLLEWCRGPALGGRRVQRAWFPLEPLLLGLIGEQAAEAQRKSLQLVSNLEETRGWEVRSDRVRLGRLLANLLANAVRYTPAGRVEFTASWREDAKGPALVLGVVDTGTGISAEEQESIFQPFERGRAGIESDS